MPERRGCAATDIVLRFAGQYMESAMARRTTDKVSSVAAKVLRTGKATPKEARVLAGSALSQDENKGRRLPAKKRNSSCRKVAPLLSLVSAF